MKDLIARLNCIYSEIKTKRNEAKSEKENIDLTYAMIKINEVVEHLENTK